MAFNKCILIGRLTAAPELKQTQSGVKVTSFTIAIDRRFTKGEDKQTDFINVVAWRNTAEFVAQWFTKGKEILVVGEIQTRSYTDNSGNKRTATEVVASEVSFVGSNNTNTNTNEPQNESYMPEAYATPSFNNAGGANFEEIANEEGLPF